MPEFWVEFQSLPSSGQEGPRAAAQRVAEDLLHGLQPKGGG